MSTQTAVIFTIFFSFVFVKIQLAISCIIITNFFWTNTEIISKLIGTIFTELSNCVFEILEKLEKILNKLW